MPAMNEYKAFNSWFRKIPFAYFTVIIALTLTTSACLTLIGFKERDNGLVDRGVNYDHAFHADLGPLECSICHQNATDAEHDFTMPDHNICGICHDIPPDAMEWTEETDISGCNLCHTRNDFSVDTHERRMISEIIWDHAPHIAADVACSECHVNPDRPTRRQLPDTSLKNFCMNCDTDEYTVDDEKNGNVVCQNCGNVVGNLVDSTPEWRNYNDNYRNEVGRCGNTLSHFLPLSSLGTSISGSTNTKLQMLHNWGRMPYRERSLNIVLKEIEEKCRSANILKYIEDDAKILYNNINYFTCMSRQLFSLNTIRIFFSRQRIVVRHDKSIEE